jgi:hypothetical protein
MQRQQRTRETASAAEYQLKWGYLRTLLVKYADSAMSTG